MYFVLITGEKVPVYLYARFLTKMDFLYEILTFSMHCMVMMFWSINNYLGTWICLFTIHLTFIYHIHSNVVGFISSDLGDGDMADFSPFAKFVKIHQFILIQFLFFSFLCNILIFINYLWFSRECCLFYFINSYTLSKFICNLHCSLINKYKKNVPVLNSVWFDLYVAQT